MVNKINQSINVFIMYLSSSGAGKRGPIFKIAAYKNNAYAEASTAYKCR